MQLNRLNKTLKYEICKFQKEMSHFDRLFLVMAMEFNSSNTELILKALLSAKEKLFGESIRIEVINIAVSVKLINQFKWTNFSTIKA